MNAKAKWDPDFAKRKKIKAILDELIAEFSVSSGGTTSVDVTQLGIDKAYSIHKLRDILGTPLEDMLFIGDALFVEGNDHPALLPREREGVIAKPAHLPPHEAVADSPQGRPTSLARSNTRAHP